MTVKSLGCENSALLLAVLTLNSAMVSTDGKRSVLGPPNRTSWVEIPSIENEVEFGKPPEIEMFPVLSGCTPGARFATTIGLVLLVARKFRASPFISLPDLESDIVRDWSAIAEFALTSTCCETALT